MELSELNKPFRQKYKKKNIIPIELIAKLEFYKPSNFREFKIGSNFYYGSYCSICFTSNKDDYELIYQNRANVFTFKNTTRRHGHDNICLENRKMLAQLTEFGCTFHCA